MHPGTAGRLSRQFRKAIAFDIWRLSARARSDIKAIYIYTYILVSFKGYPRTNLKRGSSLAEKRNTRPAGKRIPGPAGKSRPNIFNIFNQLYL